MTKAQQAFTETMRQTSNVRGSGTYALAVALELAVEEAAKWRKEMFPPVTEQSSPKESEPTTSPTSSTVFTCSKCSFVLKVIYTSAMERFRLVCPKCGGEAFYYSRWNK